MSFRVPTVDVSVVDLIVNPAEHLVFTTMLFVFVVTTSTREKVIEQLVHSFLTLEWVSLLFIFDDDMVQGEWGLACTIKTIAFSLVMLFHFWIDLTISMAWLSIRLLKGVGAQCGIRSLALVFWHSEPISATS
ncbi:hypothetical protein Scep_019671 [Stephania cephalantha]|uniref:Uncharacterized protein n=1 Tax=Stephania cephalantha TaxID=152367 RepID=A0AAP0IBG4_9MAGN